MPSNADLSTLSAVAARDAIKSGALSPVALIEACLARIRTLDPKIQAWIHVDEAGARAEAALREEEAKAGKLRGPLHGIPVGIKDIFDVQGMPTTAGAKPSHVDHPPVGRTGHLDVDLLKRAHPLA